MKLFHIQKVKGIGGSERHLLQLLPELTARGIQARMCVLGSHDYRRFVNPLTELGIETVVLDAESTGPARLTRDLYREICRYEPDLVHTHLIHADILGQVTARAARIPALSSVHSTHSFYRREPYRTAARCAGHMARRVLAMSNYVAQFVIALRLARREAVRVIPHGVDVCKWNPQHPDRDARRRAFSVPAAAVLVGVASRLIPGKGHGVLLDAMKMALHQVPNLCLLVAGDGPLRCDLDREARDLPTGSVRFLGHIDDVPAFMNACDVAVFPTLPELGEGFGLAALEAMAAARPVIATNVGPLPELVGDGEGGLIVRAGASEELADALIQLAKDGDLRNRLGQQGRQRALTNYSLATMVDQTVAVYQELL